MPDTTEIPSTGPVLPTVILAGERPGGSPISQAFSVAASVMVPVAGQPSLQRVVSAIKTSQRATTGIICGPSADIVADDPQLATLLDQSGFRWMAQASGPAASAVASVKAIDQYPVFLTAGDHALLQAGIIDDFCRDALQLHHQSNASQPSASQSSANQSNGHPSANHETGVDFVIGFVPYSLVSAAWPDSRRTLLKFSDQPYCGSNLFAVLTERGLKALEFWQQVEADRKHPLRIARRFGVSVMLRYLTRQLSLREVLNTLSKAAGCSIDFVPVNHARAAVDVDSVADQALAEQILLGER